MYFPKMYEIATKNVIKVDCKTTLNDTVEILKNSHHRSIIVIHDQDYHLFSASDLIKTKLNNDDLSVKLEDIPLKVVPQMHKNATVLEAMELVNSGVNYICVVDDKRTLYGLVTSSDIISSIDPETLMENFKIKDYFGKLVDVNYLDKNKTIKDAMVMMDNGNSDCVIVLDGNYPKGILTVKDTITIVSNNISMDNKLDNFCSCPLETVPDNFTIKEAVEYVNKKHYKRVVSVNENGKITGIINQQELISYSYNHWASMMKSYHDELLKLNRELKEKSNKLQLMATTDMLTKLYNRHMFTELFNKFLEKAKRNKGETLVLALLDIDNFKSINDTYGHNIGDEVLINISNLISTTLRSSDISARWGGEEFIVLLTNTDIQKGFNTVEQLRETISKLDHNKAGKVTVSIGITQVNQNDKLEDCVKNADDALYKSKLNGKNQVTVG